jgi:hypothetical protein
MSFPRRPRSKRVCAPPPAGIRPDGAEGQISRELNQRSEFLQELQRHAEAAHRNQLPAPDGRADSD